MLNKLQVYNNMGFKFQECLLKVDKDLQARLKSTPQYKQEYVAAASEFFVEFRKQLATYSAEDQALTAQSLVEGVLEAGALAASQQ